MELNQLTNKQLWENYYKYLNWADELWDKQEKPLLMRHLYGYVLAIMRELKNRGIWDVEGKYNVNT